jgi:hypothetical protein
MSVVKVNDARKTQKIIEQQIAELSVTTKQFTEDDLKHPQAKMIYDKLICRLTVLKEVNSALLGDFIELTIK